MDFDEELLGIDMYAMKEHDPFLAYVYFWYEALHPGATLYTDIAGMPALFTGIETPAIANQGGGGSGENIIWVMGGEIIPFLCRTVISQTGDANGAWFDFGSEWPEGETVSRDEEETSLARYTRKARAQGKGVWVPGTLANDPHLAAWFHDPANSEGTASDAIYKYTFPTGAVMEIKYPQDDGILIYRVRQNHPQYYRIGEAVILRATAADILAELYLAKNVNDKQP